MCRKLSFLLLCLLCCNDLAFSQSVENVLLKSICESVIKQNEHYLIKQKLTGYVVITDPVNGTLEVKYPTNTDANILNTFSRYSKVEQVDILTNSYSSIFPLADTVLVVDTTKFFSEGATFSNGGKYFKVVRRGTKGKRADKNIYLYAIGVRGNYLIVSVSFKSRNDLINYYFEISQKAITQVKTKELSSNSTVE